MLKKKKSEEARKIIFEETGNWALNRIKDSGANINIYGAENIPLDRNVVFISNHQSDFDIAIFMALIPKDKAFVAKNELKKVPVLNKWMELMGCVFLDRGNIRQSSDALKQATQNVRNGASMVIFPEGTRSKCNTMGEFKRGSFKLATRTNTPIIPITIDGSYKLKEQNKGIIKPANVNVYIHKLVKSDKNTAELSKEVAEIIQSKLKK